MPRWIATACAVLLMAVPGLAGENRCWLAAIQLEGPLAGVEVRCGEAGTTRLQLELLTGERRELELPLPVRSPQGVPGLASLPVPLVAAVDAGSGGSATFVEWRTSPDVRELLDGPIALRNVLARTRPPVSGAGARRPSTAGLVLLLAATAVVFATRRRPFAALGAGALGAVALVVLVLVRGAADVEGARLVDLDLAQRYLVRVEARREAIELTPGAPGLLELAPPGGALEYDGWRALAGGRTLAHVTLETGPEPGVPPAPWGRLARAGPLTTPALAEVWVRDAGGGWTYRGPWQPNTTLPAPRAGPAPPGWLVAGLPQGRGALVGRLAVPEPPGAEVHVRATGF